MGTLTTRPSTIDHRASKPPASHLPTLVYVALGVVLVYLATWAGHAGFYFEFQKPLLAYEGHSPNTVYWRRPTPVGGVSNWEKEAIGDFMIPLPPERPLGTEVEGAMVKLTYEVGELKIIRRPRSALTDALRTQLKSLGARNPDEHISSKSDASILEEIVQTTPADYEFSWSEPERQRYAARLLSKMSLLESHSARRFEIVHDQQQQQSAVLVEFDSGETTVVAIADYGVLVAKISSSAPSEWKTTAANWLPRARPSAH